MEITGSPTEKAILSWGVKVQIYAIHVAFLIITFFFLSMLIVIDIIPL